MKTIYIRNRDTYDQIVCGVKTIEIRKKSKFISSFCVDDCFVFKCTNNTINCKITKIKHFDNFDDMINHHIDTNDLVKINNNIKVKKDIVKHYSSYYRTLNVCFYMIDFELY